MPFQQGSAKMASHALAATILLCVTLFFPRLLRPLNKGWFELGLLLGRIVNPIVLGIFFFFVITPIAMVTRLFGRDELKTKKRIVDSYWIERIPPGPKGESFNHKF